MDSNKLSDEKLLYLVGTTDLELFRAGIDIGRRSLEVPIAVMKKLGHTSFVVAGAGAPPILKRIYEAYRSIYPPKDLAVGGHIGVFMYRDVFARFAVPLIFGTVGVKPFNFIDLTPVQLRIIQSEPNEIATYLDQFSDVADIEYGLKEPKAAFAKMDLAKRYLNLSRLHLHAAAAVLTGGYDYRGAVQSALLATELALKGGAAAHGLNEKEIKDKFGHDVEALTEFLSQKWNLLDAERVQRVVKRQPKYVLNRYSEEQPQRREVGHLVMGVQYLVSEIVRQTSDRNFCSGFSPPRERVYPD